MSRQLNNEELELLAFSPMGITERMFKTLRDVKGDDYVPQMWSSPVAHLYEMTAQLHVDMNRRIYDADKRHYPVMAEDEEDLYAGMVGVDYLDRFATPGQTTVIFRIPLSQVLSAAIPKKNTEYRVLAIGKHSQFYVADTPLALHYPIEIRVFKSGGVQAVWDVTKDNPLHTIDNNQLKQTTYIPQGEYEEVLEIQIPVNQFKTVSYVTENNGDGHDQTYQFDDDYYHARVYHRVQGEWFEMYTTHSAITYSANKVTAVLKRIGNELKVYIPQVYFDKNIVGSTVRVDILTTKGDVEIALGDYSASQWSWRFADFDTPEDDRFTAIKSVPGISVQSPYILKGGSDEKTFEELKQRKLDNVYQREMPITQNEVNAKVRDLGFNISLIRDILGDRTYRLSKEIIAPAGLETNAPMGVTLSGLNVDLDDLKNMEGVEYEEGLYTLSSAIPYSLMNGIQPISMSVIEEKQKSLSTFAEWLNNNALVYSPFYYSLENKQSTIDVKAFDLDNPQITARRFLKANTRAQTLISTDEVDITKTDTGYRLWVTPTISGVGKDLPASAFDLVVGFVPYRESEPVWLKATYYGEEKGKYVYVADIEVRHLIGLDNTFQITNFTRKGSPALKLPVALKTDFTFCWLGATGDDLAEWAYDAPQYLSEPEFTPLTLERNAVAFGQELTYIAKDFRSYPGEQVYKTHDKDVYAYYDCSVPKYDQDGMPVMEKDQDGKLSLVFEHKKGDPVLVDGAHKLLFTKGTTVYENGEPVVIGERGHRVYMDILVVEGMFKHATNPNVVDYYQTVISDIVQACTEDMGKVASLLLPNTKGVFSPVKRIGSVYVGETTGESFSLQAQQPIKARIYLDTATYNDLDLRETLDNAAHRAISDEVVKRKVSVSGIARAIEDTHDGIEAVGVQQIAGKFGSVIVVNDTEGLTLPKQAFVDQQGQLSVRDFYTLEWVEHTS